MASKAFTGGAALEARLAEIAQRIGKSGTLRVGFLEDASYPNGTPVATVAAIQEFGAPGAHIPPRPFFRTMIAAKKDEWGPALGALVKQHDYDGNAALTQMGQGIEGQLQQSIRDTNDPPLAPATVAAKGFDKPLVDTGHMLNSVDSDVQ